MTNSRLRDLACILSFAAIASIAQAEVRATSATFRTSDGVSLHYFDAGSGPALVLIPGWTMAADIFEPQINELSQRFRVVALDPRSQGDSEKTADGNTLERHAQDISELLEHLDLHDAVLLGWSNGVPDALTFVDQNGTAKLRGLVLVDGFVNVSDPQMQKAMFGMLKSFQADRHKFTDGFVRSMYASKQPEEYILRVEKQSLKTPTNTAVVEIFNVVSKGDFTPILAKVDKPVLYICGARLESQGKIVVSNVAKARVEVFKDAGHAMFVDDAERFDHVVSDFVESVTGVSKTAN